jgi:hypothetical protein
MSVERKPSLGDADDVVVVEGHGLRGVGDDGGGVGGDDVFTVADADEQRRALAGADENVGLVLADDGDGVRAGHFAERGLDCFLEVDAFAGCVELTDEHGEDLCVGLAGEGVAFFLEVGLEDGVVLDDAVVDEADAALVVAVRVGVFLGDAAVGGPAGVGESDGALQAAGLLEFVFEVGDASDGAADVEAAVQDGDAGGVISPVLEAFEPFEQQRLGWFLPDVGDDTAHRPTSLSKATRTGADERAVRPPEESDRHPRRTRSMVLRGRHQSSGCCSVGEGPDKRGRRSGRYT